MGEVDDEYDPQAAKKKTKKKKRKKKKAGKKVTKKLKEAELKIDFNNEDKQDDEYDDDDDEYNDVRIMDKTKEDDTIAADMQYQMWMDEGNVEVKFDMIMQTLNPAVDAIESVGILTAQLIWKC